MSELRYVYRQDAYHMYLAIIVVSRLGQTRESRRCKEMGKKGVRLRYLRKNSIFILSGWAAQGNLNDIQGRGKQIKRVTYMHVGLDVDAD